MDYNVFGDDKKRKMIGVQFWKVFYDKSKGKDSCLFDGWKFPVLPNATFDLADDFVLKPMVFVHGYMASAVEFSGLCREFASHGHIVFALDMIDGSCAYTEL